MPKFSSDLADAVRQEILEEIVKINYLTMGRIFWCVSPDDPAHNDIVQKYGGEKGAIFVSLANAYDATTTGRNDTILLNADGVHELDEMMTVSKDKVHFIGLGTHGATDMSPRIIFSATGISSDSYAVVKVTGNKCTFTNLRINNWSTHSSARTALWDAGEGTVYDNCQFNFFEDLNQTTASDVEARGDSTTWRNCKFGSDTLLKTVARPVLRIKGTGAGARMKNNIFEDCYFVTCTTQRLTHFIEIEDVNSLAYCNVLKNCIFLSPIMTSLSSVQLDNVIQSASGLLEGNMLFVNPAFSAVTLNDTGQNNEGITVVGALPHNTAGEAQTPATS